MGASRLNWRPTVIAVGYAYSKISSPTGMNFRADFHTPWNEFQSRFSHTPWNEFQSRFSPPLERVSKPISHPLERVSELIFTHTPPGTNFRIDFHTHPGTSFRSEFHTHPGTNFRAEFHTHWNEFHRRFSHTPWSEFQS